MPQLGYPRWRMVGWGLVALAIVAAGVWWVLRPEPDESLARVRASGVLRVGYAVEPPYAMVSPEGAVLGESPDVAREVARRLGVRPAWVQTQFDRLLDELEQGRFDLIAAGMFINPDRAARVRFSRPTLRVRPGWLAPAGNPKGLGPYTKLTPQSGLRLAVVEGSVEQRRLGALLAQPGQLMVVPDAQSGLAAVSQGVADGLALSLPTVRVMAAGSAGRLEAVAADADGTPASLVALAGRRQDIALMQAVDDALARHLGSDAHRRALAALGLSDADLPDAGHDKR